MKRALLLLIALVVLALGVRWIVRACASERTKVRWRLEEMRDGFNRTKLAPVVDALSERFVETESRAGVELVEQALVYVFFEEIDPKTKRFALVADADVESWNIEILDERASDGAAQPLRATARGECRLLRTDGDARKLLWRTDASLELEKDAREGWLVTSATLATLEGARRAH